MSPAELWRRLWRWRQRDRLSRELNEELAAHLELLARDYRAAGMSPAEADAAARRQLGSPGRIRELSRDSWGFPLLDALLQDLRYSLRGLRKSPGFTAAVILTLGLGLGANAAMFGVVDRLMFRPFPLLRQPARVHRVYLRFHDRGREVTNTDFEYARYLDLRRWTSSFSDFSAFATRRLAVGSGDAARERNVAVVNASFFGFFNAPPAAGRYFVAAEDSVPRGADVAVLDYGFWQSEFGGRDVLGRRLQVGDMTLSIIGVAPRGFVGVSENQAPAVYLPITTFAGSRPIRRQATTYFTTYNWGWMEMMVRRKPGISAVQASADLSAAYLKSWNAERALSPGLDPAEIAKPTALAAALKTGAGPDPSLEARTALWVSGGALIVLLIACANVANLFLARTVRRQREVAVRLALGISRGRLLGTSLLEAFLLAGLGSIAGLLIAQWGGAGIRRLFAPGGASLDVITDWRTLGVCTLIALLAGLLTGLAPALVAARGDVAGSLKSSVREGTYHRSRLRTALLVGQAALSVVLLSGAGLFVRSLERVKGMRMGYDVESVLLGEQNLRGMQLSSAEQVALGRRLLETAQAIPGVEHAAWVGSVPFYSTSGTGLYVEGIDSVRKLGRFSYQVATADYFPTMGTRIVRGRAFGASDRPGTPRVGVVSESMARVLWPGKDALGQCMRVGADTMPCTTVIGIAEDAVQRSLVDDSKFHYYLPIEQFREDEGFALLVRVRGDPDAQVEAVRRQLQKVLPGQAYVVVRPLHELIDAQRRSWRFGATMFAAFGVLALLVAAVGLYGVISYNVAQRMHELGVRIALGAQTRDLVRLVVSQGIRFAVVGILLGAGLALLAGKWIQPLLFQQSASDPLVFGSVATLLLVVALLASFLPARKAAAADPNSALRAD